MTTKTAKNCPAKECGRPAAHVGDKIVCELGHRWAATEALLRCPKCKELAHHIQIKVDLVACVFCSKSWKLDQIGVADQLKVGIVKGDPACDRAMRAADVGASLVLDAGAVEAVADGSTSLAELVGRFKRGLVAGGIPKR